MIGTMYSTAQAAKKLGIGRDTLHRLREGLKAPKLQRVGGVKVRLWSDADLARARRWHRKIFPEKGENYDSHAKQYAALRSKLSPSTINCGLRTLRRALKMAAEWKTIPHAPKIRIFGGGREPA